MDNWLISLVCPKGTHEPVMLKHKTPVSIGRIPAMRIVDPRSSRNQLQLVADCHIGEVKVTQQGGNSSALDGLEMIQGKEYTMKQTSTLYVLTGHYPQKLKMVEVNETHSKNDRTEIVEPDKTHVKHEKNCNTEAMKLKSEHHSGSKSSISSNDSSKHKSETSRSGTKRRSSSSHDEHQFKKPKVSFDIPADKSERHRKSSGHSEGDKKHSSAKISKSNNEISDEEHVKDVAAKLKQLKESAKGISYPSSTPPPTKVNKISKDSPSPSASTKVNKTSKESPSSSSKVNIKSKESPSASSSSKVNIKSKESPSASTSSSTKVNKTSRDSLGSSSSSTVGSRALVSEWTEHNSIYVYTCEGLQSRGKVAAFDIDGTIITTQSGKVFPTDPGDWRLLYHKEIPRKIKKLYEDGFKIVFITNQMGVSKGKTKISDLKNKFEDVVDQLGIPIQILVSTKGGLYRKPCTGMWKFLTEKGNDGITIEIDRSIYVGDAAGRPKDWVPRKKKDFSSSDRLFALNTGLKFFTPEEYFLGYPTSKFVMPEFDPRKLSTSTPLFEHKSSQLCSVDQEVVVFVGYPASGKSFFTKKYFIPKKYVHINRDMMGTWQKCVTACKEAVKNGKSVVIDNTNPDVESRARYVQVAKDYGLQCRCFLFNVSHMQARHNERFREITDKNHAAINDMIMNGYKKKYVPPVKKEGFSEIVNVNFVPKFTDPKLEELYKMFLLEK